MENQFEVTPEIMKNAKSYLPILLKEQLAVTAARDCVKTTGSIHAAGEEVDEHSDYMLPPVYCESTSSKARVLLSILLNCYLKVPTSDDSLMCSINDYDDYASCHILNQIERYKSTDMRGKAFDLIADYREMEKYLNSAIYSVLRELNDPITRLVTTLGASASQEGVDMLNTLYEQTKAEIKAETERQERIVNGEEGEPDAGETE